MRRYAMVLCVVVFMVIFGFYGDANAGISSADGSIWNQYFDFPGVHINTSAGWTGEMSYMSCGGYLQQGVKGRYYKPEATIYDLFTYEGDPSEFYFNASWEFLVVGEEKYIPNFNIKAGQDSYIDAFGIHLSLSSYTRNHMEWVPELPGDPEKPVWHYVPTDDIDFALHFGLEPARVENTYLSVNEWMADESQKILRVYFSGNGHFVAETEAEADALGSMFIVIPEPATVVLLGLGGLFLTKRKCKASS